MTEQGSSDGFDRVGTTGADPDRAWWLEPDPVEVFAAGMELAIRQLHVEVAALRAERDGLRLEVEGLRAKLAIAQEQLTSQSGIGDAVRELQTIVGRLAMSRPDLAGPPPPTSDVEEPVATPLSSPIAVGPVVFPTVPVVPDVPEPIVDLTVEPAPVTPAPPIHETPREPTALEQLAAMGLWPPRPRREATNDTSAFAPPAAVPSVDREPLPPRRSTPPPPRPPAEPVISWDPASSRTTPVAAEPTVGRVDVDEVPSERGRALRVLTKVGAGLGILAVVLIMAVTVGPRFLPYQTYFVRSGSMEPTIHVGAMVVLTKTDATKLEVGDIITFENPDKPGTLVTHRIVGVENGEAGRTFTTKGDANGSADSWRVPAQGDGWKYAFNVPLIGYVFGYLGTPQARLALLAVPAAILGVLSLLDIWSPAHRKTKKGGS
ncbi:MAG TPA: signal peptidase I [Acidimicrobiales bacterium]|nr:signal peptidase I [Acidimicrobiales bacterium]